MTSSSSPCGRAASTCRKASSWWGTTWLALACRCCSSRPLPSPRGYARKREESSMFSHPDPEVLVVGAGPVGLVAALFLQRQGVRVEIIDMHQRTTQHSYALAIHPRA